MLTQIDPKLSALADALTVPDGGFSIVAATGENVTSGYAVSIYPERERIITGGVTGEDLADYLREHADALTLPGRVFGGWRDPASGAAFLDVSVTTRDLPTALALARSHGQLAVFDFAALTSIPTDAATLPSAA